MRDEDRTSQARRSALISVVTPVFNEADNLVELVQRVRKVCVSLEVRYEHLVIDNNSSDGSFDVLRALAQTDPNLKVIRNLANYGHIRSPFYGMLQASGEAVIAIPSDLQTPPEVIPQLVNRWNNGGLVVLLQRTASGEGRFKSWVRSTYYMMLRRISGVSLIPNATGEGLYDRSVLEVLRKLDDPNPFVRGLVAQLGFPISTVEFVQEPRRYGESKNGWRSLFDIGLLGLSSLSRTPLRLISIVGIGSALLSLVVALVYLIRKLLDWDAFELGLAPIAVGLFFLASVQLAAIGLLGEYVGNIFDFARRHPLVLERQRINFDLISEAGHEDPRLSEGEGYS